MNEEILLKLERASRDRDFFILNKESILNSYLYIDGVLAKFIDVCCMKFKTFQLNKVSYIYGSIVTIAAAFVVSNEMHFKNARGNAIEYLCRDIYPLFVKEYETTNLVEEKTQSHMLKGCVDEYFNIIRKVTTYKAIGFDSYYDEETPNFYKYYFNQIINYCAERRLPEFDKKDVFNEIYPLLKNIFDC